MSVVDFDEVILYYENFDLENVITPVNIGKLKELLGKSGYNPVKSRKLIKNFTKGFSISYERDKKVKLKSPNLKLRIGNEIVLWNKVMKEVKEKRYAGLFAEIPFADDYIQSPIGLVPKDGGKKCRLIFHLSYPKKGIDSVNYNMPKEKCSVKYKTLDDAIRICLQEGVSCCLLKSDLLAAFRHLGIKKKHWRYLIMKARSPLDGKFYYFIDKCLPFGAAISCAHFQNFLDTLAHIVRWRNKLVTGIDKPLINYLDDFLFIALLKFACNKQMELFMEVCQQINFPVSKEKSEMASTRLVFLGLLIDTVKQLILLPKEKIEKGKELLSWILNKKSKKVTINELQKLCGFLNFLGKAIMPGRAFTQRMYYYTKSMVFKPHHHVRVAGEIKSDMQMWMRFLNSSTILSRPFLDLTGHMTVDTLDMYSDASKNGSLSFGATCYSSWMFGRWEDGFVRQYDPSIEYLELFALLAGFLKWGCRFRNKRIVLFFDNQSVVEMVNNTTSSYKNCMVLIRLLVLESLVQNVRVFAKFVCGRDNYFLDALSWMQFDRFHKLSKQHGKEFNVVNDTILEEIWPISKIWLK